MSNVSLSTRQLGGATTTTSGTNITLSATSVAVQNIIMTAAGLTVTLPDATTLTAGTAYTFRALQYGYNVLDSAGNNIISVIANTVDVVYLMDNTTAAGSWSVTQPVYNNGRSIALSTTTDINGIAMGYNGCVASLSSTKSIYIGSDINNIYAILVDTSTSTITPSQPIFIVAPYSVSSTVAIAAVSATRAIMFYQSAASAQSAILIDISGSTLIASAPTQVSSYSSNTFAVAALSSTQFMFTVIGTSSHVYALTVNLSGNTITNGTPLTVNAVTSSYLCVTAMSTTQAICAYVGTSGYINAVTLNVSGTTVSAGAILVVNSASSLFLSLCTLSSTQAAVTYRATSSYLYAVTLNVSGTTITAGSPLTALSSVIHATSVSTLTSTTMLCTCELGASSGYVNSILLTVSGTSITNSSNLNISYANNVTGTVVSTSLSSTQVLCAWMLNNYPSLVVVNISGTTITTGAIYNYAISPGSFDQASMSSTTAMCMLGNNIEGAYIRALLLSVSGTTITAGPICNVTLNNGISNVSITSLSATQAIGVYASGVSGQMWAVTYNVSGTTITAGTPVQVTSSIVNWPYILKVIKLSTTTALVVYSDPSYYINAAVLTVSGTSISVGSIATSTNLATVIYATAVTSTLAAVVYSTSNNAYAVLISVAGTTATINTPIQYNSTSTQTYGRNVTVISPTQLICMYTDAAGPALCSVNVSISGTTLSVVSSFTTGLIGQINALTSFIPLTSNTYMWGQRSASTNYSVAKLNLYGNTILASTNTYYDVNANGNGYGVLSSVYPYVIVVLTGVSQYQCNATLVA